MGAFFQTIADFFRTWGAKLAETFLEEDRYRLLLTGLGNTLIITLGALCISIVIGSLIAVVKYCGSSRSASSATSM